jgi:hypothetical protein
VRERFLRPNLGGRGEEQEPSPCAAVCREEEEGEVLLTIYEREGRDGDSGGGSDGVGR